MTEQLEIFAEPNETGGANYEDLFSNLQALVRAGVIHEVDYYFPQFLKERLGEENEAALKAAALLTYANRQGHVGIDLTEYGPDRPLFDDERYSSDEVPAVRGIREWPEELEGSVSVGSPDADKPLVLEGTQLYLQKYHYYETGLAQAILRRTDQKIAKLPAPELAGSVYPHLEKFLKGLYELQKMTCLSALVHRFAVITGGPGTGKTYTVLRLLALFLRLADDENLREVFGLADPLRIAIAAPTGKAAARVRESILKNLPDIDMPDAIKDHIPTEAKTLHRLLRPVPNSPHFRHNRENPLPYDVVIVDEASMVDLALMYKLTDALHPETRLILLGDKDQLASVEAGAVLGDICHSSGVPLSPDFAGFAGECGITCPENQDSQQHESLRDAITELTGSKRFSEDKGIGRLAAAVNKQDADQSLHILREPDADDISWHKEASLKSVMEPFAEHVNKLAQPDLTPDEAFNLISEQQILCAHRRGSNGSEEINRHLEGVMRPKVGRFATSEWFPGRLVMFTRNDYNLELFNGDLGIALYSEDKDRIEVFVERPSEDGGQPRYQALSPAQICGCETAYAMSVHKSQGSEFKRVLLVLPEKSSPVLTKELFYTALTRAEESFEVVGSEKIIRQTIRTPVKRSSGLAVRLW